MTTHTARLFALAVVAVLAVPAALVAADPVPVLVAKTSFWTGFVDFWTSRIAKQEGVVLVALGVGVVSLFIITRGKWKK